MVGGLVALPSLVGEWMIGRTWLLACLVTALAGCSKKPVCDDDITAFVMSQEFIKRQLKSPSTAEFPLITDSEVSVTKAPNGKSCIFHVRTPVDAQNSFGATVRSYFTVDLRPDDERGVNWTMVAISGG